VISTTGDPATPYNDGVALAKELDASLISVQGSRHTAYLSAGIDCVDEAGTDYLVNLTLPADGLSCQ
jgi:TAP-like protein